MKKTLGVLGLFLVLSAEAWSGVVEIESAGPDAVWLGWEAVPEKIYQVMATPDLVHPSWTNLTPNGVSFSNVIASSTVQAVDSQQFYRIARPDLDPPEIARLVPAANAVAVATNAAVYITFSDATGVAPNTLSLSVADWTGLTSASPYVTWSNNTVIFSPPAALGEPGATISNSLAIADTLGHTLSNYTWTFELERTPAVEGEFLALTAPSASKRTASGRLRTLPNVKPKDGSPSLQIVDVTPDTVVFSYEGTPPTISNGTRLVSFDAAYPFYRTVVSNAVDAGLLRITAWTADISLTNLLTSGSFAAVQFSPADPGLAVRSIGANVNLLHAEFGQDLGGTILHTNANLKLWLPECTWALTADVDVAAAIGWGGLESFDASARSELTIHIKPEALIYAAVEGGDEFPLVQPISKVFGGMIGPVPVWIEVIVELNAGYEYEASVAGNAHTVVDMSKEFEFTVQLRQNRWTHNFRNPDIELESEPITWQLEGNARAKVYVQPKLTVLAYSLAGLWADVVPYAELEGWYQLNPLQYDWTLYYGLSSTLGIESRIWHTNAWGEKPEWTLYDERWPLWTTNYPDPSAAPVFSGVFPNRTVPLGGSLTLSGWASGIPEPQYRWFYNGMRIVGATQPEYAIRQTTAGYAGTYTVQAYNDAGSVQASCTVTIASSGTVSTSLYIVVDLSEGPSASSYPISFLDSEPIGGWTDEYKTTKLVLRRVPAGIFTMGSPTNELGRTADREEQRVVTLTKDFYVGIFETTQQQWERVMGEWPSYFTNTSVRNTRPVESISYNDIRGDQYGKWWPISNAVDDYSFMGQLRNKTGLMFDLPTDTQWEYACRAETSNSFNNGKDITSTVSCPNLDEVGRYKHNHPGEYSEDSGVDGTSGTAKVGSYLPNKWGMYDMHGNVREWCLDWQSTSAIGNIDPVGLEYGINRAFRGGAWGFHAYTCRSARRTMFGPGTKNSSLGFRAALQCGTTQPTTTLYRLFVSAITNGTVNGSEINGIYPSNALVANIHAYPNNGYLFAGWEGDVPNDRISDNPLSVVMDKDRSIVATYSVDPTPVNAIINGDFEQALNIGWSGTTSSSSSGGANRIQATDGGSGYILHLTRSLSSYSFSTHQTLSASKNSEIYLKAKLVGASSIYGSGWAEVRINCLNSSGSSVGAIVIISRLGTTPSNTSSVYYSRAPNDNWNTFHFMLGTEIVNHLPAIDPNVVTGIKFEIRVYGSGLSGSANAYVDDVSIINHPL